MISKGFSNNSRSKTVNKSPNGVFFNLYFYIVGTSGVGSGDYIC